MYSGDMGQHRAPAQYAAEEIDLMELFAILWDGKWIIAAVIFCGSLAAGFAVWYATPSYLVEAAVSVPSEYSNRALQPSVLVAQQSDLEEKQSARVPYQVQAVDADSLYLRAITQARSLNVQKSFWEQKLGRPVVLSSASDEDEPDSLAFRRFVKDLSVSEAGDSGAPSRLTLKTADPEAGVELLTSYLQFVDGLALRRVVGQLDFALEASLARLESDQTALYQQEKLKLQDEMVRLQEAREMAQSLDIVSTPYEKMENIRLAFLDDREYLLGTTVLDQQIAAIRSRLEGAIEAFVPELRRMDRWREQMARDRERLQSAMSGLEAFAVITPPEASLEPVGPSKVLILVAAIFVAGLLGVIIVFMRHAFKVHQARSSASTVAGTPSH